MKDVNGLDAVPLDRMPDRFGRLRVLITADECAQLLDLGYEVRLHRHYPIQPLDARLIATDKSVEQWLEERLAPVRPADTRPPKRATKRATKKR
jgi:hypothetical protein